MSNFLSNIYQEFFQLLQLQSGACKGSKCQFHSCDTLGNRQSHFYQDGALSLDKDTRNSE